MITCPNCGSTMGEGDAIAAKLAEAEQQRDAYKGILLRIAATITPIRDADKEQQHANDMHATMERIGELDEIVNSRVCDLECDAAQAEARVATLRGALKDIIQGYDGWLHACEDPEDGCQEVWQEFIEAGRAVLASQEVNHG